jgi:hypothetical protein
VVVVVLGRLVKTQAQMQVMVELVSAPLLQVPQSQELAAAAAVLMTHREVLEQVVLAAVEMAESLTEAETQLV